MTLDDMIQYYDNMAENSLASLNDYRQMRDWLTELREFKDGHNWARAFNEKGELCQEFALYLPKVPVEVMAND